MSNCLRKYTVIIDVVGILLNKYVHVIRRNVLQLTPNAVSCSEMILRSKDAAVANMTNNKIMYKHKALAVAKV